MSTSTAQPPEANATKAIKSSRAQFEDMAWSKYFISTIGQSDNPRGFALVSKAEMDKATLCKVDSDGDYVDTTVSIMWAGWQSHEEKATEAAAKAQRASTQPAAPDAPKAYMGKLTVVSDTDGGMENTVHCLVVARSAEAAFETLNDGAAGWFSENEDEVQAIENDITGGDEPAYAYEASNGRRTSVAHRAVVEVSPAIYQAMKHHLLVYTQEGCPEPVDTSAKIEEVLKQTHACLQSMWTFAGGLVEKHGMDGDDTLTDAEHAAWQAAGGEANWIGQVVRHAAGTANTGTSEVASQPASDAYAISPAQRVLFEKFSEGDFANFSAITSKAEFESALEGSGDGLLRFLAVELATGEDCVTFTDAVDRLRSAQREMSVVYTALEHEENAEVYASVQAKSVADQQRG